jgi:hypothetical protein
MGQQMRTWIDGIDDESRRPRPRQPTVRDHCVRAFDAAGRWPASPGGAPLMAQGEVSLLFLLGPLPSSLSSTAVCRNRRRTQGVRSKASLEILNPH